MKKIIAASLLLSAMSYGVSEFLARESHDMMRFAAGLPTGPIVIPEIDPSVPQRVVTDFDHNDDVRPMRSESVQ